jgi:hypothetical protein
MVTEQATKLALGAGSRNQLNAPVARLAFGTDDIGLSHIRKATPSRPHSSIEVSRKRGIGHREGLRAARNRSCTKIISTNNAGRNVVANSLLARQVRRSKTRGNGCQGARQSFHAGGRQRHVRRSHRPREEGPALADIVAKVFLG